MSASVKGIFAAMLLLPSLTRAGVKPDSSTCSVNLTEPDDKGNMFVLTSVKVESQGVVAFNEHLSTSKVKRGKERKAINKAVAACEARVRRFEKAGTK